MDITILVGGFFGCSKAKLHPIEKLTSNPFQVHQDFDSVEAVTALAEQAACIKERGILQPILV